MEEINALITLLSRSLSMWRFGFFFHEMALGLFTVLLPLYIVGIGGSLVDIGVMSAIGLFSAIPFSFFWGYMCDKTRRYKRFILLSFLSLAIILYLFTLTTDVHLLIILYVAMQILHIAHEPSKNVLIAESYSRQEWERTFALYEGFTEIGVLIGLLSGLLMSTYRFGTTSMLLLCSLLNLAAFAASIMLITDPLFVFERRLVNLEKTVNFAYRGIILASKMWSGISIGGRLKRENLLAFCSGLVLFSFATSVLFTPLPIFFSKDLALTEGLVFAVFVLNSGGGVIGYFLAGSKSRDQEGKAVISKIVLFRSILAFLLIAVLQIPAYNVVLAMAILILMGLFYGLFLVNVLSISMELIPEGKAGLFNVLVSIGGVCGSFIGPFLAQTVGFIYVFLTTGIIFLLSYVAFKLS